MSCLSTMGLCCYRKQKENYEIFVNQPIMPGKLIDQEFQIVLNFINKEPNNAYFYDFSMQLLENKQKVGHIELNTGYSDEQTQYYGNIGYTVYQNFRGKHYAARACKLIVKFAKEIQMKTIWICINPDNIASEKTAKSAGAQFYDILKLPEWHSLYKAGDRYNLRYKIEL